MALATTTIADVRHPNYDLRYRELIKWRFTYLGGLDFKLRYLQPYSGREDPAEFENRQQMTPVPAFAKSGLQEIRNMIYQRFCHVSRAGGSPSYTETTKGRNGGVTLSGHSMNTFIGDMVLTDMLVMSRVGVFVDMPQIKGQTIADTSGKRPYLYMYQAENIRSWTVDENNSIQYNALLLRDTIYTYDSATNLANGTAYRYRHLFVQDNKVHVQFYDDAGTKIDLEGRPDDTVEPIILDISRIPFVIFEISDSLLTDVADYQIALLNLESSDISFILKSNFPFYTEQFDALTDNLYVRGPDDGTGEAAVASQTRTAEVRAGISQGRRYPLGAERPGFIAPPGEPLKLSMQKQQEMRAAIRELMHLAVANLKPVRPASATIVAPEQATLESGLAYIGQELQSGENLLAEYWAMMEGRKEVATVKYPEVWTIKGEDERHADIEEDRKNLTAIPSLTYKRQIAKRLVRNILGPYESEELLDTIDAEIDKATTFESDFLAINKDVESGLCDLVTAAKARGYPDAEKMVEQAKKDHVDRLKRIAEAQSIGPQAGAPPNPGARGLKDQSTDPGNDANAEKTQSQDKIAKPLDKANKRGAGQKPKGQP